LSIEPTGRPAVRTTVFKRTSCAGSSALDRDTSTREALEGTYVATLTDPDGANVGSMTVDVDPESATTFTGDVPSAIPAPLAAAAAQAVDAEVAFIYESVVDVNPTLRTEPREHEGGDGHATVRMLVLLATAIAVSGCAAMRREEARDTGSPRVGRLPAETGRHAGASAAAPHDARIEDHRAGEGRARRLSLCRPVQLRLPLRR
jgi:hypothetical protein